MIDSALNQARGRLRLAERAFQSLQEAGQEMDAFNIHWRDFLVQWKGTYTKLQQAAKQTPQEVQWLGEINTIRRKDPLLRWLFEARNDEEHGVITSAVHNPDLHGFYVEEDAVVDRITYSSAGGFPRLFKADGKEIATKAAGFIPAQSALLEVTEKDGKRKVPPPTSHLGKPIDPKPLVAAEFGLEWLQQTYARAEEMHKVSIQKFQQPAR